jgi:hypothetical protein
MSKSALSQLAKLTEAVTATKREIAIAGEQHEATRRELEAAKAAISQYHADVVAGARAEDDSQLDALIAAKARTDGRMDENNNGRDIAVTARIAHLRKVLDLQQQRVDLYVSENRAAILAEKVEIARGDRARLVAATNELKAAVSAWQATAATWAPIADALGLDKRDIPAVPFTDAVQRIDMEFGDVAGVPHQLAPCPWWALNDDELPASGGFAAGGYFISDPQRVRAERLQRAPAT